jgi:hypothetical protein
LDVRKKTYIVETQLDWKDLTFGLLVSWTVFRKGWSRAHGLKPSLAANFLLLSGSTVKGQIFTTLPLPNVPDWVLVKFLYLGFIKVLIYTRKGLVDELKSGSKI